MKYEAKKFDHILGTDGFSDNLLKNHFTLYEGYVTNFNKLNDLLSAMEKEDKFGAPEFAELNRRFGWEFNGMRLHELYFGNISKGEKEVSKDSELYKRIEEEWGSYDMWEKDFRSIGAMRGIGWVVLYSDKESERLFNVWINEHDTGHLSGAVPLLVMDVFEHAFLTDYGLKRADYIVSFMKAIDWSVVEERLK
ncbi:MAG: superoxide dismutase [Parcubacteria group bacterium CG10_big_fil_rev_8_21_14_0_10_38_31]|nr:MAG: superoxide dismutase [Parcubacteria group bacterium CG10_big_fil_rev_8_21_14_0_10_38_31]